MKKYRVSLALKVGANYEIVQKARNAKEAVKLALARYDDPNDDDYEITEPDWATAELDIGENLSGVHVEKM